MTISSTGKVEIQQPGKSHVIDLPPPSSRVTAIEDKLYQAF